jgi:hypothetical protein
VGNCVCSARSQIECLRPRHCEEPFDDACGGAQDKLPLRGSDAAIQRASGAALDCFASLAMTEVRVLPNAAAGVEAEAKRQGE